MYYQNLILKLLSGNTLIETDRISASKIPPDNLSRQDRTNQNSSKLDHGHVKFGKRIYDLTCRNTILCSGPSVFFFNKPFARKVYLFTFEINWKYLDELPDCTWELLCLVWSRIWLETFQSQEGNFLWSDRRLNTLYTAFDRMMNNISFSPLVFFCFFFGGGGGAWVFLVRCIGW